MVRRYRGADQAASTLDSSVNGSTTTWPLASSSSFPSEGDFHVKCDDEIALATHVSGDDLTVIRGQCGTTAVSHTSGKAVTSIITANDIDGALNEHGLIKTLPYARLGFKNGNIVTSADFSLVNGSSSSIANSDDGIIELWCRNHSSDDLTGMVRTFSNGVDKDFIAHIAASDPDLFITGGGYTSYGLWVREAPGGAMKGVALYPGIKIAVQDRTTYLTGPSDQAADGAQGRRDFWAKLEVRFDVVATTDYLTWYYSWDGIHWFQLYQHTFAFGGYQCGLWARNHGQDGKPFQLLRWYEGDA